MARFANEAEHFYYSGVKASSHASTVVPVPLLDFEPSLYAKWAEYYTIETGHDQEEVQSYEPFSRSAMSRTEMMEHGRHSADPNNIELNDMPNDHLEVQLRSQLTDTSHGAHAKADTI